ncbi:hypothetical protein T484DRAFT_1956974, partial [Baffinella frigidus]
MAKRWLTQTSRTGEATWQAREGWRRTLILASCALLLVGVACLWVDAGPDELEQSGLEARAAALRNGEVRLGGSARWTRAAVSRLQSKLHELRATQLEGRGVRQGRGGPARGAAPSKPLWGEAASPAPAEGRERGRGRRGGLAAADPEVEAAPEVVSSFAATYKSEEEKQMATYNREKEQEEAQNMKYVTAEAHYRSKRAEALLEQARRFREERSGDVTPPPQAPPANYFKLSPWEHLPAGSAHRRVPEWTKKLDLDMQDDSPDPWKATIRGTSNPGGGSPSFGKAMQTRTFPNPLQ